MGQPPGEHIKVGSGFLTWGSSVHNSMVHSEWTVCVPVGATQSGSTSLWDVHTPFASRHAGLQSVRDLVLRKYVPGALQARVGGALDCVERGARGCRVVEMLCGGMQQVVCVR